MRAAVATSWALLAAAVFAAPFEEDRRSALDRRSARRAVHQYDHSKAPRYESFSRQSINGTFYTSPSKSEAADDNSGPGGWGGVIAWNENSITQIEATVSVPTPAIPPNGASSGVTYGGAAWIGIGAESGGTLWQTGITWTIEGSMPSFTSWYEWFPAGSNSFPTDLNYGPGDEIYMSITTSSSTSGTAYLENLSTQQSVTMSLNGQADLGTTQGAQFLVEDFESGSSSIPFAAFSPAVQYTSCSFTDAQGGNQGISGATILNVGSSGAPFTSTNIISSSSFSVSYTGNAANS